MDGPPGRRRGRRARERASRPATGGVLTSIPHGREMHAPPGGAGPASAPGPDRYSRSPRAESRKVAKRRTKEARSARHGASDGHPAPPPRCGRAGAESGAEGVARKDTLNPHLCIHRLTYVFTVWSRTLSILTGLRDGRRSVIHDVAVVGARPCGPSKTSAVSSASAAARSEPARRLAAERSAAPMALWIESAAREASVSPGTCGEKRGRRDEHLHARAPRVSRGTERVPTPGGGGVARGARGG
jgi:hypothetical protein